MSVQDPVDVVRSAWERHAQGGLPAMLRYLHEDVEWAPHDPRTPTLHGHGEILAHGRGLAGRGTRVEVFGHRFEAHELCVVVIGRVRALSAEGHYDIPMAWQVDVEDGLITRIQAERRVEDAREDCSQSAAA